MSTGLDATLRRSIPGDGTRKQADTTLISRKFIIYRNGAWRRTMAIELDEQITEDVNMASRTGHPMIFIA